MVQWWWPLQGYGVEWWLATGGLWSGVVVARARLWSGVVVATGPRLWSGVVVAPGRGVVVATGESAKWWSGGIPAVSIAM